MSMLFVTRGRSANRHVADLGECLACSRDDAQILHGFAGQAAAMSRLRARAALNGDARNPGQASAWEAPGKAGSDNACLSIYRVRNSVVNRRSSDEPNSMAAIGTRDLPIESNQPRLQLRMTSFHNRRARAGACRHMRLNAGAPDRRDLGDHETHQRPSGRPAWLSPDIDF